MRRRFNQNEFSGLGVYQQARQPHNSAYGTNYERYNPGNVFQGYGAYEMVNGFGGGMPEIPGLDNLGEPVLVGGLQHVDNTYRLVVINALEMLSFEPDDDNAVEPVTGKASYQFSLLSSGWFDGFVQDGYVVLAEVLNVSTGSVAIVATKNPQTVYNYAKQGGSYSIVDGPDSVIAAASALAMGGGGATPGTTPVMPPVLPPPGTPALPGPAVEPAKAGMPGWVIPVAVGGALLLVTLGIVAMNKKKSPVISYTDY